MRAWFGEDPAPLPPPTPGEVIEALAIAREYLSRQPHLAKGIAFDWVGGWPCFCIVAAITATSRTKQIRDAAMSATRRALPGRWCHGDIEAYNDARDTTVSDAKALLQSAKSYVGAVAAA